MEGTSEQVGELLSDRGADDGKLDRIKDKHNGGNTLKGHTRMTSRFSQRTRQPILK